VFSCHETDSARAVRALSYRHRPWRPDERVSWIWSGQFQLRSSGKRADPFGDDRADRAEVDGVRRIELHHGFGIVGGNTAAQQSTVTLLSSAGPADAVVGPYLVDDEKTTIVTANHDPSGIATHASHTRPHGIRVKKMPPSSRVA
jgi:hypothetical protein